MDERGVVAVTRTEEPTRRGERRAASAMASKWCLKFPTHKLFAFSTHNRLSSKIKIVITFHTRTESEPLCNHGLLHHTPHSLVSQRAFCWEAGGYGDHPWVNIPHDLASGKNRLFAVLFNCERHAAKASRTLCWCLRQASRQRMSTQFASGRDYASVLSLFVVATGLSVVLDDYPSK
ncbi:hypothetical protein F5888DRAFT_1090882 [Russula emetica]|nr:hypothetical protein F5888DRAFT_1090882 [Russula emetica]